MPRGDAGMSNGGDRFQDRQFSEAEQRRIESEISKNEAEQAKLISTREIRGIAVRIIYTKRRMADANEVKKRLSGVGAKPDLFPISDRDIKEHAGKLYYKNPSHFEAAEQIKALVADIESLEVELSSSVKAGFLYVWVV